MQPSAGAELKEVIEAPASARRQLLKQISVHRAPQSLPGRVADEVMSLAWENEGADLDASFAQPLGEVHGLDEVDVHVGIAVDQQDRRAPAVDVADRRVGAGSVLVLLVDAEIGAGREVALDRRRPAPVVDAVNADSRLEQV